MIQQSEICNYCRTHDLNALMWSDIGQIYQFNESFIREFREKLDWYHICKHQKLSEDFMREFITKLWPLEIVKYQNVSLSFV